MVWSRFVLGLMGFFFFFWCDKDCDYSPVGQIQLAGMLLEELVAFTGGWTGPWVEERKQASVVPALPPRPPSLTDTVRPVYTGLARRVSESGEASRVHVRGTRVGHVCVDLGSGCPSLVSVRSTRLVFLSFFFFFSMVRIVGGMPDVGFPEMSGHPDCVVLDK